MAASVIFDVNIDGWAGLLVSVFIVVSGLKTAKESLSPLMGQMPEKELVEDIKSTVNSYEGIIGMHDLIVHNYGPGRVLISLHAEVPADGEILAQLRSWNKLYFLSCGGCFFNAAFRRTHSCGRYRNGI